jgi:hypothetical protein
MTELSEISDLPKNPTFVLLYKYTYSAKKRHRPYTPSFGMRT